MTDFSSADIAYLSRVDDLTVYKWLESNFVEPEIYSRDSYYSFRNAPNRGVEYYLAKRNSYIVDLGLARYGAEESVIKKLYEKYLLHENSGSEAEEISALTKLRTCSQAIDVEAIQLAIISNRNVPYLDVKLIKKWLNKDYKWGGINLIKVFATNPYLSLERIAEMIAKTDELEELSEEEHLKFLLYLQENKRIRENFYASNSKIHKSICDLMISLPVNAKSLQIIHLLLLGQPESPDYMDDVSKLEKLLIKWKLDKTAEEDGTDKEHSVICSDYIRAHLLLRRWKIESYESAKADLGFGVNEELDFESRAEIEITLKLKYPIPDAWRDSDDAAYRLAFYRGFRPKHHPDWHEWDEANNHNNALHFEVIESFCRNRHILSSEHHREMLSALAWGKGWLFEEAVKYFDLKYGERPTSQQKILSDIQDSISALSPVLQQLDKEIDILRNFAIDNQSTLRGNFERVSNLASYTFYISIITLVVLVAGLFIF